MSHFAVLIVKNEKPDLHERLSHLGCQVERHYQVKNPNLLHNIPNALPHEVQSSSQEDNLNLVIKTLDKVLSINNLQYNQQNKLSPHQTTSTPQRKVASKVRVNSIFLKKSSRYVKVLVSDICWIEACRSSLMICTEDNCKYVLTANLKSFESQFSHPDLVRVHRSFIVNLEKIEAIYGRQFIIKGREIPYSDSYLNNLSEYFPMIKTKV